MANPQDSVFGELESAIATWNMRAGGTHEDIGQSIETARSRLEEVARLLQSRRTLAGNLVLARVKLNALDQSPDQRAAAVGELLKQIKGLEEDLAAFHVEAQTLDAQAKRAIHAAVALNKGLLNLHGEQYQESQRSADAEAGPTAVAAARELELEQRIVDLEKDLSRVTDELRHTREQLARGTDERAALARQLDNLEATAPARDEDHEGQIAALQYEIEELRRQLAEAEELARVAPTRSEAPAASPGQFGSLTLEPMAPESQMPPADVQIPERPSTQRSLSPQEWIRQQAFDEHGHRRPMGTILVTAGLISANQLEEALREQRSAWNRHLGAILVDLGFASEEAIAQALAAQLRLPYIQLRNQVINPRATRLISAHLAQHHTCIPFRADSATVDVAMANPLDLVALEDLQLAAARHVEPFVATATEIKEAIQRNYRNVVG